MKGGLTSRILAAGAVLVLVVGAAFAVLILQIRDHRDAAQLAGRAAKVDAAASDLERIVVDLQTAMRGFVIAGDERFLEPLVAARARLRAVEQELETLTLDPDQRTRIGEIEREIRAFDNEFAEPVVAAGRSDIQRARELITSGEGERRMDSIRAAFVEFFAAQDDIAAAREQQGRDSARRAIELGVVGLAGSVLLLLIFTGYLRWTIVRPVRSLSSAAQRLRAGELSVRVPAGGPHEVGELARSFNAMATSLQESVDELESQNVELEQQQAELEAQQGELVGANDELEAQRAELEAQQVELEAQQVELETTLSQLGEEKERVEAFYRFGESLAGENALLPLAVTILHEMADLADAEVGALYSIREGDEAFRQLATRGLDAGEIQDALRPGEGLAGRALSERRTVAASHGATGIRLRALGEDVAVHHEIHTPLLYGDRTLGVVTLARVGDRPFSERERHAIEHLADQAAVALANSLSFAQAVWLADLNRAVLNATRDAIRLVDLEGRSVLHNAAMERLANDVLELPAEGTIWERTLALAERTTDPEGYRAAMARIAADPEYSALDEYELVSGHSLQRHTAPVRDAAGNLIGRVFALREITAERAAEALKSELVSTVSHELRTPLASIVGFTELLIVRDLDDPTRERYLETIYGEAKRLTTLINDFLDLQRIEEGGFTLELEPFALGEVLRQQVDVFSGQSTDHRLELRAPAEELTVLGDRDRVAQVVANILSNAIKYSPGGGDIEISVEPHNGVARVSVSDSGLGIPGEQQDMIFDKFFRVDSSDTREIGGTGLGLALCREIVEAHGGRIGFESAEGEGSSFWFELPRARRDANGSAPRVLVVEDDPAAAAFLSECLAADGYSVEVRANGEAGLARALEDPPAVVCLDLVLPGALDGWQVLGRLKESPATAHVPVVVCTAGNGRHRAAALGAADFLTKPFSSAHLSEAVRRLLPGGRGSVLVVDDEEAVRALVRETLSGNGLDVREAGDGEQALAEVAVRAPDVIVLDLTMPVLDGFGVLERLQASGETRLIPVIVLTARRLSAQERTRLSERATALFEKSAYSAKELRDLVTKAVGVRRAGP